MVGEEVDWKKEGGDWKGPCRLDRDYICWCNTASSSSITIIKLSRNTVAMVCGVVVSARVFNGLIVIHTTSDLPSTPCYVVTSDVFSVGELYYYSTTS